jgi:hypothetical protein
MLTATGVLFAVCCPLLGCSESTTSLNGEKGKSIEVTRASWHDGEWPFTVPRGILGCQQPPFPGAVTFNVDGTLYGVNGQASEKYEDIKAIWRPAAEGLRVDIGPMIERGLKLCEEAEKE